MALKIFIVLAAALVVASGARPAFVQCEDSSLCPDGATCCKIDDETWGCCPYEFGQCCKDGAHCCPLGYSCDAAQGSCVHKITQQRLFRTSLERRVSVVGHRRRNEMIPGESQVGNVRCPDGNYCLDGQTCCLLTSGRYGCCPYQHAECCSDHTSCCPEGYRCRISTHQCVHATTNHTVAMVQKVSPIAFEPGQVDVEANGPAANNVRCPDGNYCLDGQTCCLLASGHYGCCPYQHAECCSDHTSCCPEGYRCRISTHQCVHATTNHTVAMVQKVRPVASEPVQVEVSANELLVENVRCPDGSYCLDGQTCCLLTSGRYGCCPYQHAECCSDHTSCCPEGYRCRISTHQCVHATTNHTVAMVQKVSPIAFEPGQVDVEANGPAANNVRCPDGNYCLDGQTCCLLASGHYGCCPYQHAECCSDHTSCCPEGYRCRISTHQCVHATTNHTVAMVQKVRPVASEPVQVEVSANEMFVENVRCPDGSYCLDGQTCCLLTSGRYGCCPYQHAECCSDHTSCCPEGYLCKISTHQCIHTVSNHTVPMVRKVEPVGRLQAKPSVPQVDAELLPCPDGSHCQNTQTCCLLNSGRYGCCPYAHAECCSDHTSCCPEGYRCKVSTQQCVHATSNRTVAMLKKVASIAPEAAELSRPKSDGGVIQCGDGSTCFNNQTCCELYDKTYDCCPYPRATCCEDQDSCCPEGYICVITLRECKKATTGVVVPMHSHRTVRRDAAKAVTRPSLTSGITCPDGHKCLNGQTCCELSSDHYGCCPLPEAVCCSDHQTCCPRGYQCRVATQTCQLLDHTVPAVRKLPAFTDAVLIGVAAELLKCPDGSYCQNTQTCCLLTSGHYGCCPYAHAQCCSDHTSCCPEGYRCQVSTRQCVHATSNHTVTAARKVNAVIPKPTPLSPTPNGRLIHCEDGTMCFNNETCCPLLKGSYYCCDYPRATCCEDYDSCCPEGYICIITLQKCKKTTTGEMVPMRSRRAVRRDCPKTHTRPSLMSDMTCPDGHKCAYGQTCCHVSGTRYGCCPLPNAVCCEDDKHCCPAGYVCNVALGTCVFGDVSMPMVEKVPGLVDARLIQAATVNQFCPDGNECDDEQTCCQLQSGSYGCCPYNQAVCCDDRQHCCPQGYTCDTHAGRCLNGNRTASLHRITPKGVSRPPNRIPIDEATGEPVPPRSPSSTVCPGGRTTCPDSAKCCLWYDKLNWFCCPYANGTCCSDGTYCCKPGFYCFVPTQSCIPFGERAPGTVAHSNYRQSRFIPLSTRGQTKTTCPDESTCPDFTTCCKSGNYYACCPFREATCCSDGQHCCPHGFDCDEVHHMCRRSRRTEDLPWLNDIPSQDEMFK